uniref:Defensin n=1 Tax=Triticum urartu TaxID=4572 RepID=A0A8R7UYV7_TRIUA
MARKVSVVVVASILIWALLMSCDVVQSTCHDYTSKVCFGDSRTCSWWCKYNGASDGRCNNRLCVCTDCGRHVMGST